ncbi:MAG: hypothetical protein FJX60_17725 [Alphaproteobacteria bacterium]|nr:hypothetical protein [Alphaproteobacteria bacterium]
MTLWLLVFLAVSAGKIEGAALVMTFVSEELCLLGRQHLGSQGIAPIRDTRCVEVSLGEPA